MLDKQDREQSKKRRRFREFKSSLQAAKNGPRVEGRFESLGVEQAIRAGRMLENHDARLQRIQRTHKGSPLKSVELSEKKKEELKAKIREVKSSQLKSMALQS